MQKRVVVFGAHPDDVEIGMGGTIKRLSSQGHEVITCIAVIPDNRELRFEESRRAGEILGAADVRLLPLESGELGYNRKTIMLVDQIIKDVKKAIADKKKLADVVTMENGKPKSASLTLHENVKNWVGDSFATQVKEQTAKTWCGTSSHSHRRLTTSTTPLSFSTTHGSGNPNSIGNT